MIYRKTSFQREILNFGNRPPECLSGQYRFSVWDMVESVLLIASAITTIVAGRGIVGVALLIAGIVCLQFSAYAYIHSIMLMCAYMEGDEEAGKELVEDMWINIGVTIGTFALRTIAKPIISKVLKNKLVREFGQEFVDKLLKNTDDIPTAGRAIKRLRKLNVGDDAVDSLKEGKTPDEVRAARGNNKTGTIWDNIIGTADNIPGTEIPATFQINLDGKINYVNPETGTNTLWTNANTTEHMGEYVSRFGDESWIDG